MSANKTIVHVGGICLVSEGYLASCGLLNTTFNTWRRDCLSVRELCKDRFCPPLPIESLFPAFGSIVENWHSRHPRICSMISFSPLAKTAVFGHTFFFTCITKGTGVIRELCTTRGRYLGNGFVKGFGEKKGLLSKDQSCEGCFNT
jgi:hypothetical protein